jgi:mRNA-degrading endonuclease RelE of RelBE toxin-antitoxin system
LTRWPTTRGRRAKELQGKLGIYRLWLAGRWRIVYLIDDESQLISILRVRRKERIDYQSLEPPE